MSLPAFQVQPQSFGILWPIVIDAPFAERRRLSDIASRSAWADARFVRVQTPGFTPESASAWYSAGVVNEPSAIVCEPPAAFVATSAAT